MGNYGYLFHISCVQAILGRAVESQYPYIKMAVTDAATAGSNLYIAAGIYLGFCIISLFFWVRGLRRVRTFEVGLPDAGYTALHMG